MPADADDISTERGVIGYDSRRDGPNGVGPTPDKDDPDAAIAEASGSPLGLAHGKETTMSKRGSGGAVPQKRDMSGKHDARIAQRASGRSLRKDEKAPGAHRAPARGAAERAVASQVRLSAGQESSAPERASDPVIAGARRDAHHPTLTPAEQAALRRAEAEIAAGQGSILTDLRRSLDQ
jgi:hypothetical protein